MPGVLEKNPASSVAWCWLAACCFKKQMQGRQQVAIISQQSKLMSQIMDAREKIERQSIH